MIDIHTHIIPFVDDGSPSVEASLEMLKREICDGVTDIIVTPHYRLNMYERNPQVIRERFELLVKEAAALPIKLYLGQEIALRGAIVSRLERGEIFSLNASKYVLLEFDYNNEVDIDSVVYDLIVSGYKPIIAHIERYAYLKVQGAEELKKNGALLQINASSVVDDFRKEYKKRALNYLKCGLVDIVASDLHYNRQSRIIEARDYITKKYGEDTCVRLFETNPKQIII